MKTSKNKKGSGKIKAGTILGVESGDRTLGKFEFGTELGVKKDEKGSGKLSADANVGLQSDAMEELKEGSDYTFDKIKEGLKTAKKKITEL